MNDLLFTKWEEVTPSRQATQRGIYVASLVLVVSVSSTAVLLGSLWVLVPILITVGTSLSLAFDAHRLIKGEALKRRYRFDDLRLHEEIESSKSGARDGNVIAFDGIERVSVQEGTLGLYPFGDDQPTESLDLECFPSRTAVNCFLDRLRARDVKIEIIDDSLEWASFDPDAAPVLP